MAITCSAHRTHNKNRFLPRKITKEKFFCKPYFPRSFRIALGNKHKYSILANQNKNYIIFRYRRHGNKGVSYIEEHKTLYFLFKLHVTCALSFQLRFSESSQA